MRVNKINWDKIGRVTEPGRYKCFFGYLTVSSEDIEGVDALPRRDIHLDRPADD
ncbi:hypothetical protein ACVWXQ_000487 [Bradyrhizobium sp. S3.14.4]